MSLSSRPIPTNRNNPCPVCDDIKGKCRILEDGTVFCHTHADAKLHELINGYKCIKPCGAGHTATFGLDNSSEWTEEKRREWEDRKRESQRQKEIQSQVEKERALSVDERHRLYTEILEELSLDAASINDLKQRGFTDEEIRRSGFKSVKRYQKLTKAYTPQLPGIGEDGRTLIVPGDGYFCPLRDFEGSITGMQLRLHNPPDGNRYRWLSTPDRATLRVQPEDENPLAVFHPPSGKPEFIAILEGTGCKPFFVSQRMNALVIGAAGGQHLSSPKLFEKYIQNAIEKYGNLPIKVIPDAGWALNSQVKQKLANTLAWLEEKFKGSQIYVLDWNQAHKSQGDVDELDDLSIIRKLKAHSFLRKYKEVFAGKRYQSWAESRVKLTADIVQREKWLTIPKGIENECDILFVRKSLGGGKTQGLIDFLKPLDIVSLLIGYRNTLLYNTVSRAKNSGLEAMHIKECVEVHKGSAINFSGDDSIKLWTGCADSFFKFDAVINNNPEYFFVHDEICSVLNHLKGGGTLKGRQQQAIEWDVNAIRNSKFSIMMDANLSDKDVEFFRQLFPEKRIKVLDSVYDVEPRTFYFLETASQDEGGYISNPKYLPSQLVEIAQKHDKVLWLSDSQTSCEVVDEILTKQGHKHYRLDGKTSQDELSRELQSNPKLFITTEKLDSLSISPSGESGLSIDLYDYFDVVCFDIRGTVGVNTLTQISARLRDKKVPIYVSCPEFVNMTADPCPYAMKQVNKIYKERFESLLNTATETEEELTKKEFLKQYANELLKLADEPDPWFDESLKDAKQLKYEHQNLRLCLTTALAQAGNRVIDLTQSASETLHDEVQDTKEFVKRREGDKIHTSPDIDWEKAQELAKKEVNYDDKCKIRKAELKNRLPGIEELPSWTSDFVYTVLLDQPDFLNGRWRMMQLLDEELFNSSFKTNNAYSFENGFTPYDVWKSKLIKIKALRELGVGRLIQEEFSVQDDWVCELVNKYYKDDRWFNLIGIKRAQRELNPDGTVKRLRYVKKMVDRFLDVFGLKVTESDRTKRTKSGKRSYTAQVPQAIQGDDANYLPDIDACLARRRDRLIEKAAAISLSAAVEKGQVKLKEALSTSQNDSQQGVNNSSVYIKEKPVLTPDEKENSLENNLISTEIPNMNVADDKSIWTEEAIADERNLAEIANDLALCPDIEAMEMVRESYAPEALQKASKQLQPDVRARVDQWVKDMNEKNPSKWRKKAA